jgi:hypothetical protein
MFPMTLSGSFTVDRPSISLGALGAVLASITARLEREKPKRLSQAGDRIEFKGGILRFVSSWNQLVAISRGEIRVERQTSGISVQYQIWFTQLLIVVTIMVGGFLSLPIVGAGNLSAAGKVAVLAIAWLWLAGGNIAITTYRFPRLLRQATENALDAA